MKTTFRHRLLAIWDQLVYTFSSDASYYEPFNETQGLVIKTHNDGYALFAPDGTRVHVYKRRSDAVRRATKLGFTV